MPFINVLSMNAYLFSGQENISRLTGQVTFPPSAKSAFNAAGRQQEKVPKDNPFRMPPDSDIFVLRDKERQNKRKVLH